VEVIGLNCEAENKLKSSAYRHPSSTLKLKMGGNESPRPEKVNGFLEELPEVRRP
jgi:hypothetical protein